ncbi:MAG TPA: Xaa-Pro aminopeptidase [Gemmatimonadaceae bacterium]|nr:Xaa-Pro aminopeptidase [Gemmatimonadaceae bacterium]
MLIARSLSRLALAGFLSLGATRVDAQDMRGELAARRTALAKAIGEGTLLVMAAPEPTISRHGYVQDQNYLYLTGLREAGGALLLTVRGGVGDATLFVADKDPAAEVWTGRRLGVEGARARTGLTTASVSGLAAAVRAALRPSDTLLVVNDTGSSAPVGRLLRELRSSHPALATRGATQAIGRLRAIKSPQELAIIRKAAELTLLGFDAAAAVTAPGRYEFELEAALKSGYRRHGADGDGFPPIIASGDNATTLHYEANDSPLPADGLVLMDVGAAYHGYVADFTRTLPVDGSFSPDQRAFYQVVLDAQLKAEAAAKARGNWAAVNDSARRTLAAGLARIGLIESADATYDPLPGENCPRGADGGCLQYTLYYMHSVGHGVGLNVHDPMLPTLEPGTVFMIEMGAYVRRNIDSIVSRTPRNTAFLAKTAAARAKYAGWGARLEDEYFSTASGIELVTPWPRDPAQVEARAAQLRAKAPPRNAGVLAKYPR